mgnify:CR=1 FL=1
MEKEEFAQLFAENASDKVLELLKDAYLKGYEQGIIDAGVPLNIDGVTYIDMGLPSGTMWSKHSLEYCNYGYKQRKLSYYEAIKLKNLSLIEKKEEELIKQKLDNYFDEDNKNLGKEDYEKIIKNIIANNNKNMEQDKNYKEFSQSIMPDAENFRIRYFRNQFSSILGL